jgi:gas vesicle protein
VAVKKFNNLKTNKMKNKNLLLGVLGGVAVGTVLGILFAPEKGSDTRKRLAEKGNDLKGTLLDTVNQYASKISETVDGLKNHVGSDMHTDIKK